MAVKVARGKAASKPGANPPRKPPKKDGEVTTPGFPVPWRPGKPATPNKGAKRR